MSIDVNFDRLLDGVQKPARYTGGELNSVVKDRDSVFMRFGFCFPDLYEVGMSHLGIKLLYGLYNSIDDMWCERIFAPDTDMEQRMREHGVPLFGLESRDPIKDFDFVGFTLQYEMCYSTVLHMLELAEIPLLAADRDESQPIVIGGGPCVCNPEPIADFFDIFSLGEGEEVSVELFDLYREHKKRGFDRKAFLREAAQIEGIYVPSLYEVTYHEDGTIKAVVPHDGAPARVRKRICRDMDKAYYPESFVVPFTEIVHDRAVEEIFRGCIRGCRFCQAGYIYRPVREKSPEVIDRQSHMLCHTTGYEEFSLSSLSTSDYTRLNELLPMLLEWTEPEKTNITLPSLRVDGFSEELANKLNVLRRSGLTFAPEAGTQRLRDAINKNLTEEEILETVTKAFSGGWSSVKLYFMCGLPTETMEDIEGIARLGEKIVDCYYRLPDRPKGKGVQISMSTACFVPKPFTPFQWEPQDTREMLREKQQHLVSSIRTRKITLNYHDSPTSFMEAVLARGDRRIGKVLAAAHTHGCNLDAWSERFDLELWMQLFAEQGLDPAFYANRRRPYDEVFPWDHIDYGITKEFLIRENQKAHLSQTTPNCRQQCAGCGASCWKEGVCVETRSSVVQ